MRSYEISLSDTCNYLTRVTHARYGRKMSPETAAVLVLRALYNATIDTCTGGPLQGINI